MFVLLGSACGLYSSRKSRVNLLPILGWVPKFLNQYNKDFMNWTENKLLKYLVGFPSSRSGTLWAQSASDTVLECAKTSKETMLCKDINMWRFFVDLHTCAFSLPNIFVYPLISVASHSKPSWALSTKKRFRVNVGLMALFLSMLYSHFVITYSTSKSQALDKTEIDINRAQFNF